MRSETPTRRRFLAASSAAAALTVLPTPYVRRAAAAGSLSIGLWDHWVPGANDVAAKIIQEWGEKEKVDVKVDFITSQGNKLLLTIAAEAQAKSGHDIMEFTNREATRAYAFALEPVDDLVRDVVARNGPVEPADECLSKFKGTWVSVPMTRGGCLLLGVCSRFDLLKEHAGIDIQAMYPAGKTASGRRLDLGQLLDRRRKVPPRPTMPSAYRWGVTTDTMQWVGALFKAYGADLMGGEGRHHRQDRRGAPGARLRQAPRRLSCRPTRPHGTMPQTTSG